MSAPGAEQPRITRGSLIAELPEMACGSPDPRLARIALKVATTTPAGGAR